jgi:hypothetical protein
MAFGDISPDETKKIEKKRSNRLRFWTIFLATLTAFGVFAWLQFRPRIHPQFDSEPYIAPAGCENRTYKYGDAIALACAEERYRFDQWREYGLPSPGKIGWTEGKWRGTYYRVGNDLVGFTCNRDIDCWVLGVESNVYRVK